MSFHSRIGATSVANPSAAEGGSSSVPGRDVVLVVDDEDDHIMVEAIVLEAAGFQVLTARNTMEAREVLADTHPNVIVVDVGLPAEDGISFARTLRKHRSNDDVAIIAYTAYGDAVGSRRASQAGCDAFLTKPATGALYVRTVKECLAKRRSGGATP